MTIGHSCLVFLSLLGAPTKRQQETQQGCWDSATCELQDAEINYFANVQNFTFSMGLLQFVLGYYTIRVGVLGVFGVFVRKSTI